MIFQKKKRSSAIWFVSENDLYTTALLQLIEKIITERENALVEEIGTLECQVEELKYQQSLNFAQSNGWQAAKNFWGLTGPTDLWI